MRGAIRVRSATAGDLDAVATIERQSFADPWSRNAFREVLEGGRVRFEVACDEAGAIIGYVIAWIVQDEGEIANLAVAAAHRRSGIAARLLDGVLQQARLLGVRTVHLEVRESNDAARALYVRFGFEEAGRRREYYRHPIEDALVLRRSLGEDG